jgi:sensor domain CHASE-containing protein
MNPENLEPKSSFLTSNWLVGVLSIVLFAVIASYFSFIQSTQAQINNNVQTQISGVQTQLSKQTAILILLAQHDGIPTQEITNLTN